MYAKIGIVMAMDREFSTMAQLLSCTESSVSYPFPALSATIQGSQVILIQCGVGKVNAAAGTAILIERFRSEAVILSGVAGSLHPNLRIGDVVIAEDVVHLDVDVTNLGFRPGEVPFSNRVEYAADANILSLLNAGAREAVQHWRSLGLDRCPRVLTGRIATSDHFVRDQAEAERIRETFDAVCVEMEGAAVGQVCTLLNVPFGIVRSISDALGSGGEESFPVFAERAARVASRTVYHALTHLSQPC